MKGDKFEPIMVAIAESELQRFRELETKNNLLKFQIESLEKENEQLKEKENTVHTLDVLHKEVVRKYGEVNDQLNKAKEIMQKLIDNAPDTYSGTNIELQQKKMFSFQDAVNKAEQFLNNEVKE